ncbi:uncharacterized protein LOC129613827 [Condylostylus longicornis]|uniref:uncharacterized protein LOC129613827 n=1 Tax=Condylostylus longicornis TaxID=2530218 RepID=UPI00244DFE1D|nr:uncharacterized protein LOC129613827 [Condylostylus longicornis]
MLSSTLSENSEDDELAVTIKTNKSSSFIKSKTSSPKQLPGSTASSTPPLESKRKHEASIAKVQTEIKNSSGNTFLGRNMTPMHFLVLYNREILCFLTLFLTTYATFHNKYANKTPYYPITSLPIFDKDSIVDEYFKGELTPLQTKVSVSGISAVLFYAPWSSNSLYVKQYFENLARIFQHEIYFAAVNCWQPGGECRMLHSKVKSWPVLVVYYPKSLAVQYNGPWQLGPIYKFLVGVLRPIHRLHSFDELKHFNIHNSVLIVGFFSKISGKYQNFYQSAAKWLEYDPLQDVKFCVVVGDVLKDFNIKNESEIHIFYRGEKLPETFSSWSTNSIFNTVKKHTKPLKKYWNGFHRQDNENLQNILQSNPALLLFVKRDYLHNNNTAEILINEVIKFQENKLKSFVSEEQTSLNNISASGNIITRKTEINQTLSYFLLDIFMYYKLAFQLGLTNFNFKLQQSTAVIIDNAKESVFVFPQNTPLMNETLKQFVDDYESDHMKRNFRNKDIPKINNVQNDNINIPEINGTKFIELLQYPLKNQSTSIILITSATCSLCVSMKLNLLKLSKVFENLPVSFYTIDGNNNDFAWQYTMGQYPTLLIIPKMNKYQVIIDDIRILPYHIEPNEKNILGFIMANLEIPERLFGMLEYCGYLKISNGFYNCLKKTRQTIESIISEQLNLWRNYTTRRKCIENNLEILRNLYYELLNAKNRNDIQHTFSIIKQNQIDIRFACDNEILNKNLITS